MSNFELIDDYLANRLKEPERKAFEKQLEGDPSLKQDVEFQRQVVDGVRQARAMELKNMLNNVPVGGGAWSGVKLAAAVVSAGLVATILYFYLKDDSGNAISNVSPQTEEISELPDATKVELPTPSVIEEKDSAKISEPIKEEQQQKPASTKKDKIATPVRKPDIQVVDPSDELTESDGSRNSSTSNRGEISPSKMEVVTGIADKKHNFHYQFSQGKLMLYGPFDKSLYEILEIHGEGHAVFLFYKENYYLLNEDQSAITALQPIRDGQLLKKLKEYRSQ